jgi:hypothetical protein
MKRAIAFLTILVCVHLAISVYQIINTADTSDRNPESSETMLLIDIMMNSIVNSGVSVRNVELTYGTDTSKYRLLNLCHDNTLIFYFSGESCSPCIDDVISLLNTVFPDLSTNERVLLIGSHLNPRVVDDYYPKPVLIYQDQRLSLPAEDMYLPCLFILDKTGKTIDSLIPEKYFPTLTEFFLKHVKEKYEL